jgi:FkbM family methyltransferase
MSDEHSTHAEFTLSKIRLSIPQELLSPVILNALETGRYEHLEIRQVPRFLKDGDRLMEFGAGLGFVSAFAASQKTLAACITVEANPALIPVIKTTHEINNVKSEIINAVALSESSQLWRSVSDLTIPFYVTKNFWGASLTAVKSAVRTVSVPVVRVEDLIVKHRPSLIICDIEGGEIDLFDNADLESVRMAFFEVHKSIIGLKGIYALTQTMAAQGLYYDPDYSVGATVMYSRQ